MLLTQKVQKRSGCREQWPRHQDQLGAGQHSTVEILDRNIKVERRLIGDHVVWADAELPDKDIDKIDDRAVAD